MSGPLPPWESAPAPMPVTPLPARAPRTMPAGSVRITFEGDTKRTEIILTPDMVNFLPDETLGAIVAIQVRQVAR